MSPYEVSGPELAALIHSLLEDPASRFHAAVSGWTYPVTREAINQLDLMDLLLMRWQGDKFKPLPRPWDVQKRSGKSRTEVLRQLRPHLFPSR